MDISTPALASMLVLIAIVLFSCFRDINVGILGVAGALIVGMVFSGMKVSAIYKGWPLNLFMILVGVTFMFSCAQVNGTMQKFSAVCVRLAKGNVALIPIILFILVTFITTIGPGNIAACALMAPMCMAIAGRIGLSPFCMTLLVVGAANGAAFSPFAPTGLISNGIIAKIAPQIGIPTDMLDGIGWKVHWYSEIIQGIVNFGGFFLTGGAAWMMNAKKGGAGFDIDAIAPKPEPFTWKQKYTLLSILVLVVAVIFFKLDVGAVAFVIGTTYIVLDVADDGDAVKKMPWGVITMVCGMSVLIDVMDQAGGLNALIDMIAIVSNGTTVNGVVGFVAGIISAYSSSSGVVMPMFLNMVPGLLEAVGTLGNLDSALALISSINIGAHLVDTSPLSTLGALCIANAQTENKGVLFRNLLFWGLSMSLVGAVVCYLAFGVLGL